MLDPFRLALLALATVAAALGFKTTQAQVFSSDTAQEVSRLAPQLVPFAGSQENFRSIANGLGQGTEVRISTVSPDGSIQVATFTPAGPLPAVEVARTLEAARQRLISQGISSPTAGQIGVTVMGGTAETVTIPPPTVPPIVGGTPSVAVPPSGVVTDTVRTQQLPAQNTTPQTQAPPAPVQMQRPDFPGAGRWGAAPR